MTTRLHGEYQVRLAAWSDIQAQMPMLFSRAKAVSRVIELGVRTGNSTAAFLAGLEKSGGELWSVDISPPQVPGWWHELEAWHLLVADDLSPEAQSFCPVQADILFIDTSHYYAPTMAELRTYASRVRPGGVILMHDTNNTLDWPDVPRAMNDWCAEAGLSWISYPAWPGLGAIEIPER